MSRRYQIVWESDPTPRQQLAWEKVLFKENNIRVIATMALVSKELQAAVNAVFKRYHEDGWALMGYYAISRYNDLRGWQFALNHLQTSQRMFDLCKVLEQYNPAMKVRE